MAGLVSTRFSLGHRLSIWWLSLVMLTAVLADVLPLPYLPGVPDLSHVAQAPFGPGRHWLGTDLQGRDVLSVLVFGARTAVLLTLPAAVMSALLGGLAGGAAGFWGNHLKTPIAYGVLGAVGVWWAVGLPFRDAALVVGALSVGVSLLPWAHRNPLLTCPLPLNAMVMGTATTLDTVPRLVLVVAVAAGTGMSAMGLLLLLTLTAWSHPARLVRAQMLRVRTLPFVESAKAAGVSPFRVWLKHALPHALQPLRTALPLSVASLLGLESTLSFLGIGLPPNVASWGRLLGAVREEPSAWWIFIFPSICLSLSILSLNSLSRNR